MSTEEEKLKKIKEDYEKTKKTNSFEKKDTKALGEFVKKKNYFPSKEVEKIRLVTLDGKTIYDETGHFHVMKVNGKFETLYCPKHNDGEECPLCEKYETLIKSEDENQKKEAYQYKAKKYFMVKLLDRNKQEDLIKIWRIPFNSKGQGDMDKLIALYDSDSGLIHDLDTGRDIKITMTKNESGKYKPLGYIPLDKSPISQREENKLKIIEDYNSFTWRDVFMIYDVKEFWVKDENRFIKHKEYLQLLANGKFIAWDSLNKKMVIVNQKRDYVQPETVNNTSSNVPVTDDTDDNLPF